jgi:hypothetical protein
MGKKPPVALWGAKFVVPAWGLFGLYAGGFVGADLAPGRERWPEVFFLASTVCALLCGWGAMRALVGVLCDRAAHAKPGRIVLRWAAVTAMLSALGAASPSRLSPQAEAGVWNAVLFGVGVATVGGDEPAIASWGRGARRVPRPALRPLS